MITIDRLFHTDLTHAFRRASARYEPLSSAQFDALFSEPQRALHDKGVKAFIKPICLFPKDEAYVDELARTHQACSLFVTLKTNREDAFGEPVLGQDHQTLPLSSASLAIIRGLLPERLASGLPLLAEVEISLDGPLAP